MATKKATFLATGINGFLNPVEALNALATDTLTPGIVGLYTATSGVAPTTGALAVNAQGAPNMTVAVTAGSAYLRATPSGGTAQMIRIALESAENVTIAPNSSGSTKYDFVYAVVDAAKLNNPSVDGTDVFTLTTQRSTTSTVDSNGALANALCIAIVTVVNGAVAINNADISDYRIACSSVFGGWQSADEAHVYASATTVTVPAGALGKYSVGDKYRIYQNNTIKYFYIVGVASTLLTITGGSDYTLTNSTINNPCTSRRATPVGFPQWFNYTPTWTNFTIGSGTTTAQFSMNGKTVNFDLTLTLSSSTMGASPAFTLPVTAAAALNTLTPIAEGRIEDSGTTTYLCKADSATTTTSTVFAISSISQGIGISSTSPMTWANSDKIVLHGSYRAA